MLLIFATPEEGWELLGLSTRQKSGPCVHYGLYGCEVPRDDGQCPHLDNASIVCPIKDALGAAQAYAPAEPESVEPEPDDGALHTYTVPATRKPHPSAWSDEEEEVIRRARNAKEAVTLYYGAYPQSSRTYAAVQSRWYRLRAAGKLIELRPGDRVRITHALYRGQTGKIERHFPATDNYLVAIDGMPDRIILTDAQMEVV